MSEPKVLPVGRRTFRREIIDELEHQFADEVPNRLSRHSRSGNHGGHCRVRLHRMQPEQTGTEDLQPVLQLDRTLRSRDPAERLRGWHREHLRYPQVGRAGHLQGNPRPVRSRRGRRDVFLLPQALSEGYRCVCVRILPRHGTPSSNHCLA